MTSSNNYDILYIQNGIITLSACTYTQDASVVEIQVVS